MKTVVGRSGEKLCLFILLGWFVLAVYGCGPLTEETDATAVLTDDFSSYTGFPESPWAVISGDSSSWTIVSASDGYAANFNTTSSANSYLLNGDFCDANDTTVSARMKIVTAADTGSSYGLYLRAADDLSSSYKLIFDIANDQVQIIRMEGVSTEVLRTVTWSVGTSMTSYHTYRFKIYVNTDGSVTLSAYVDGALVASAADSSPLTAGYYTGFFFSNVLDGYISYYQITQP